ncbi:MAG: bifunctional folylpolyglutamate synthase/dihydrofolate synthase [Dehalococcoidales bacterium]|nr:bifunctional folylpolyglutamate synthase/dihydrofolate synthase [Dehalococcoidales bacterium]
MDYQSALDYILTFADYERMPRSAVVFDLRRIRMLLERLGNPQETPRTVHITGTKGKGSTSAMVASILTQAGYHTGLYTSPHLLSFTERIQFDGKNIPEDTLARITEDLQPHIIAVNQAGGLGNLTTFEIITALSFVYYREMKADYQVLEVGLGGRLDATNVVKRPDICVITSISFDHTDVLGDTLEKIANEKAGIIKPGAIVVTAPQPPEAMAVIEKVSREKGCRLIKAGVDLTWQLKSFSSEGQLFNLKGIKRSYELILPLLGEHQLENAASAVAVAEVLAEHGAKITPEQIIRGLMQVRWPGRLQVLRRRPALVIDGAHNAYSIKRLGEALRKYFQFKRLFLIFGASSDKDIAGMCDELAVFADEVIVTHSHNPRSVSPDKLAEEIAKRGIKCETEENVASAIELALGQAAPDDLICVTGSIFVIAEVLEQTPVC